jgi:hypothetical protein
MLLQPPTPLAPQANFSIDFGAFEKDDDDDEPVDEAFMKALEELDFSVDTTKSE